MWLRAYGHELGRGDAAAARRALDRAVAALPARKHIKVGDKSYLHPEVPHADIGFTAQHLVKFQNISVTPRAAQQPSLKSQKGGPVLVVPYQRMQVYGRVSGLP